MILTTQAIAIIQPLVDGGPHPDPDGSWWWPLVEQLVAAGFVIVDKRRTRGAALAWTQRGMAAIAAARSLINPPRPAYTVEEVRSWRWRTEMHGDAKAEAIWVYQCEEDPRVSVLVRLERRTGKETRSYQLGEASFGSVLDLVRALNALTTTTAGPLRAVDAADKPE